MSATDPLLTAAMAARNRAHAPYSKFKVGAAVEALDGTIVAGCNIENASFGLTICAERVALGKAIAEGLGIRRYSRIAVVTDATTLTPPCGACRQVIWELAGNVPVILRNLKGETKTYQMADLLPDPFEPSQFQAK